MKQLACVAVIAFAASLPLSITAAAQSEASPQQQPKPAPAAVPSTGCPISMHASQIGGGTTVMVDNDGHRHSVSRGLHLSLTDPLHTANIVSADLTVYGLNGKPHSVESGSVLQFDGTKSGNPWEMTRNLTVNFGPAAFASSKDHSAETELSTAGFASVTWIRLNSLTLSDGTVWIPNSPIACRTVPDPFMLVNAQAGPRMTAGKSSAIDPKP